ncbi:hypothetical protein SAMN04487905_104255 [Actinopolyspora xinjiangensis]|uniref:Uncharacterized protein n=1 Tax=Actinopolyspora xinjiangensis TaxID=405564 RepID=A0A1H0SZ95_9ACTN|nr:hypothetical protein [Actinopolyspora xinjiangensis]SDP47153.1 hypothetical protein SAMN04487905_104255 [Actinopolyspora xinjiangensis]
MAGGPVETLVAGLDRVARMEADERAAVTRELGRDCPMYRSLLSTVTVARTVAFASGLALCVAVLILAQDAPMEWVAAFVFAGLFGFGWVVVRLTDNRFDLLLAVLGTYDAERGWRDGSTDTPALGESCRSDDPVH